MIRVLDSSPIWLSGTQTWGHTQITQFLADRVEGHVMCERTENLEQFPIRNLHDFSGAGAGERTWDCGLRRPRARRHLGPVARVARVSVQIVHSHFGALPGPTSRRSARRAAPTS